MKAIVIKLVEQGLILALIAFLSFFAPGSAALANLGAYGPIVGAAAAVLLTILNRVTGQPVQKVAAKLSPRPF